MSVKLKRLLGLVFLVLAVARPASAQITDAYASGMSGWVGRNNLVFDPVHRVYLSIVYRAPVVGRFLDVNGVQIGGDFVISSEPGYTAWASIAFGGPPDDPVFLVTYLLAGQVNHLKYGRLVRYVPGGGPSVSGPVFIADVLDEWGFSEKAQSVWNGTKFVVGTRVRYVGVPIPTFQVNTFDMSGAVSAPVDLGDGQDYYGSPAVACSSGNTAINTCMAVGFMAGYFTGYSGGSYGRLFNMTTLVPITGLFPVQATGADQDQQVVYQAHLGRFLAEWLRGAPAPTGAIIETRLINVDGSMSPLDPTKGFAGPGAGSNTISYNEGTRTTLLGTKMGPAALHVVELGDDGYPINLTNAVLITNWDGTVQDYTTAIAANPELGQWLVTGVLASSTVIHRIHGTLAPTTGQPLVIVTNPVLPTGAQTVAYSASLFATGGVTPHVWSVVSGTMPPGLGLSPFGISGTPTTPGSYAFRLRVTGADAQFVEQNFTLRVSAVVVVPPGPAGAHINDVSASGMSGWVGRNNLAFDPVHRVYLSIVYRAPVVGRFLDVNGVQIGGDFVISSEPGYTAWASIAFGGPPNDPVFLVTYLLAGQVNHQKYGRLVRYVPGAPNVSGPVFIADVLDEWGYSEKAQSVWNGTKFVVGTRVRYVGVPIPTFQVNTFDMSGAVSAPVDLGDGQDYYGSPALACSSGNTNINTCMAVGFMAGYYTGYSGGSYGRLFNMTTLAPKTGLFPLAKNAANEDQQVVYQTHMGRFLAEWLRGAPAPVGAVIDTRLIDPDGSMSILDLTKGFAGPGAGCNTISYNESTHTTLLGTKMGPAALHVVELGDDGYPLNLGNAVLITNWDGTVLDYTTSIAANPELGQWLVTGVLASSTVVHVVQGTPVSGVSSANVAKRVRLDADSNGDAFVYRPSSGAWKRATSAAGGGFQLTTGGWSPGWSILPANFNADGLTDMFVFSATTGQWFKMINDGTGFTTQSTGDWWPGWERYVMDLDSDGISDLFLYDPTTGQWFKCLSTPTGFTYQVGAWGPGWEIYPMDLDGDALSDLFLYSRTTGQWVWALGSNGSNFTYPVWGAWAADWKLYPGDFSGNGLTDLLLHRPGTGEYYVATTTASGFTYLQGGWAPGWTPTVIDLDANGKSDVFLYSQITGQWVEGLHDGFGTFIGVGTGFWDPGWALYATDFNHDNRTDLLLYKPSTGQYFQAWNLSLGSFAYFSGMWDVGSVIVTGQPIR